MSTNIHFVATRMVAPIRKDGTYGEPDVQEEHLYVWQTPTKVTYEIMESSDKVQAYFDWVLSLGHKGTIPVYAEDDIFSERDPIGYEEYSPGEAHIKVLKKEIESYREREFEIRVEAW